MIEKVFDGFHKYLNQSNVMPLRNLFTVTHGELEHFFIDFC